MKKREKEKPRNRLNNRDQTDGYWRGGSWGGSVGDRDYVVYLYEHRVIRIKTSEEQEAMYSHGVTLLLQESLKLGIILDQAIGRELGELRESTKCWPS